MEEKSFMKNVREYLEDIVRQAAGDHNKIIQFMGEAIPAQFCRTVIKAAAYQVKKSVSEFSGETENDEVFHDYFEDFLFRDFFMKEDAGGTTTSLIADLVTEYGKLNADQLSSFTKASVRNYMSKRYGNDFPFEAKTEELLSKCFAEDLPIDASTEMGQWQPLIQQQVYGRIPVGPIGGFAKGRFRNRRICSLHDVDRAQIVDDKDVIDSMRIAKKEYETEKKEIGIDLLNKSPHIYITKEGSLRQRYFPEVIHKSLPETENGKVTHHIKVIGWAYLQHFQTAILDYFIPSEVIRAKKNLGIESLGKTGKEGDFIPPQRSEKGSTLPFGSATGGYSVFKEPQIFEEPAIEGHEKAKALFDLVKKELSLKQVVVWRLKIVGLDMDDDDDKPLAWESLVDFFNTDSQENREFLRELLLEEEFPELDVENYLQEAFTGHTTRHQLEKKIWPQTQKKAREFFRNIQPR